jgi:hypothetical protein
VLATGEFGKVVELTTSSDLAKSRSWCIVDEHDRTRLALASREWNQAEVEELPQARGLQLEPLSAPRVRDGANALPGLLPASLPRWLALWVRRPWAVSFGFVFAVIALVGLVEAISGAA